RPTSPLLPYATLFRSLSTHATATQRAGSSTCPLRVASLSTDPIEVIRVRVSDRRREDTRHFVRMGLASCFDDFCDQGLLGVQHRSEEHTSELQSRENL